MFDVLSACLISGPSRLLPLPPRPPIDRNRPQAVEISDNSLGPTSGDLFHRTKENENTGHTDFVNKKCPLNETHQTAERGSGEYIACFVARIPERCLG